MVLEKYDTALRMRSIMERVARSVIDRERPTDKVARVIDVDRGAGFAYVVYAGDESTSLRVRMYPGRQPQFSDKINGVGNGSVVRVSGPVGSRYIAEVLSDGSHLEGPKIYQPRFAAAGAMEDWIYSYFTLRTTGVPPKDGETWYYTAVMNFPFKAGSVEIYTEMLLSDGSAYQQRDEFKFDSTTMQNADIPASNIDATSAGMYLSNYFVLYDGIYDDEPAGTLGCTLSQQLDVGSTKTPVYSNILLKVFATNAKLVKIVDGISLSD